MVSPCSPAGLGPNSDTRNTLKYKHSGSCFTWAIRAWASARNFDVVDGFNCQVMWSVIGRIIGTTEESESAENKDGENLGPGRDESKRDSLVRWQILKVKVKLWLVNSRNHVLYSLQGHKMYMILRYKQRGCVHEPHLPKAFWPLDHPRCSWPIFNLLLLLLSVRINLSSDARYPQLKYDCVSTSILSSFGPHESTHNHASSGIQNL